MSRVRSYSGEHSILMGCSVCGNSFEYPKEIRLCSDKLWRCNVYCTETTNRLDESRAIASARRRRDSASPGIGFAPTWFEATETGQVVVAELGSQGASSGSGISQTVFGTFDVTAGVPILLVEFHRRGRILSVEGGSLTWDQVATIDDGSGATTNVAIAIYRALPTATTPLAVTVVYDGSVTLPNANHMSLATLENVAATGTRASDAIVQYVTADTAAATTATVTLASFGSSANATFGALLSVADSGAITAGTGFTLLETGNIGSGTTNRYQKQWKSTTDTTVDWSWVNSVRTLSIALELRAAT